MFEAQHRPCWTLGMELQVPGVTQGVSWARNEPSEHPYGSPSPAAEAAFFESEHKEGAWLLPQPPTSPSHLCCKPLQKQQPSYRCLGIVLPFPEPELQSKSECLCWVRDELRGATAETLLWLIPNPPSHHSGLGWSLLASLWTGKAFSYGSQH